jgi:periplasmic mercuric ion binding protein
MTSILKRIIITFALFLFSSAATAQKAKSVEKAMIKTAITCDHCKQCPTCGGLLERTLIRQNGIRMIALDEKEMTITVIYNPKKINLASIRTAISKLGYDADDVKADPKGYDNLDGCCKA